MRLSTNHRDGYLGVKETKGADMAQDDLSSQECAILLKVLADKDRLRMLQLLRQGPLTVSDIAEFLSLEIANVSHHLGVLRRNGLVLTERDGKNIYYELAPNTLHSSRGARQHLNLGCCRLEIPSPKH